MKIPFKQKLAIAIIFLAGLFLPLSELNARAAKSNQITDAKEAVKYLRELQFNRDFELGEIKGEELSKKYPKSVVLHAWYLANMARNDKVDETVSKAEKLVENNPDNPWSYFALARALNSHEERGKEAIEISERALSMKPDHPDFLWMKAAVYYSQVSKEEAISYIDSVYADVEIPAHLLAMKGHALMSLSRDKQGEEKEKLFQEALEVFKKARNIDSGCFDAYYLPGYYLNFVGEKQKAYHLLKKSVSLSTAIRAHSYYWRSIMGMDNMKAQEKEKAINSDIESLLARRPETAEMLQRIAGQYEQINMTEKQQQYEEKVLEKYPNSVAAEWVLVGRYRAYSKEHGKDIAEAKSPEKTKKYRIMLWDFINRPQHQRETLIGDAYRELFYTYREDSTVSSDSLLKVVEGMVEYEGINPHITHADGAKVLAKRGVHFKRAKQIAREGIEVAREKINEDKEWAFDTEEEYQEAMDRYTGIMYDALGWVFFHEGELDSARKYLAHSYSLNNKNDDNLYHLGKLEEEKGNLAKAEDYYKKGLGIKGMSENPNKAAIKMLYISKQGSPEGFEAYLAKIQKEEKGNRKEEILASRLEDPEPLAFFKMKNLSGESVSSKALTDKIAVINIWGKWCGPCVKEMPDIQKLHKKYSNSSEVVILTINNDTNIDEVRKWMKEREFDFPVLRDNGYLNEEGIHLFPTTWFVNKKGEIAFIQEGYTDDLVQEFSWRVDAMESE